MKLQQIVEVITGLLDNTEEKPILDLADDIQIEIHNVSVGNYTLVIRVV